MHKAHYILSQRRVLGHPPLLCERIAYVMAHRETIVMHTLKVQIPGNKASQAQLTYLPADPPQKPYSPCCPSSVGIDSILPPSATMVCIGRRHCSAVFDRRSSCLLMHNTYFKSFGLL